MPDDETAERRSGLTDWVALGALSDDDVERIAVADEDNPATLDEDEWADATIGLPPAKTSVHALFDSDVVAFFKRGGRGYQSRMNAVLRRYMEVQHSKVADGRVDG